MKEDEQSFSEVVADVAIAAYQKGFKEGFDEGHVVGYRKSEAERQPAPCDICGRRDHHDDDHSEPWEENGTTLIRDDRGDIVPHIDESKFLGGST